MFDKAGSENFFDQLGTYMSKTDSLLESHYNLTCPLREDQKVLVLELYANSVVVYRFMEGLIERFGKDKSISWAALARLAVKKEDALRLSEMVKVIVQIIAELEYAGIKLGNN